ncbi:hypothetical protein E2C01_102837 [Portunus trituberculatus]|uniref:Uncharacterized protein n=1 Tax=Portunus trituberculatus TaxID=210409 RepID=A0A5B7KJH8_PORTR|nr:hypothetical protein [Portunus trituberculatus]
MFVALESSCSEKAKRFCTRACGITSSQHSKTISSMHHTTPQHQSFTSPPHHTAPKHLSFSTNNIC